MSLPLRTLLRLPRRVAVARATYATIPTKNTTPSPPIEPSREQAMPIGAFYEAILNTPQPLPDVKPEEPATPVKEAIQQEQQKQEKNAAEAEATTTTTTTDKAEAAPEEKDEPSAPARRTRKPKKAPAAAAAKNGNDPAATKASPSSTAKATAKQAQAAAKSSSVSTSADASAAAVAVAPVPIIITTTTTTPPPSSSTNAQQQESKVTFGPSLAGPAERAERLARIRAESTSIAGVLVPPKPEEPDNCCMSGCVNCVWDRFRDEMEVWVAAKAEADRRLASAASNKTDKGEQMESSIPKQPSMGAVSAVSMDDDGGGSDTNWDVGAASSQEDGKLSKDFWNEELFQNVPVGIREFMKQEKKLKEKHMREGTSGG